MFPLLNYQQLKNNSLLLLIRNAGIGQEKKKGPFPRVNYEPQKLYPLFTF